MECNRVGGPSLILFVFAWWIQTMLIMRLYFNDFFSNAFQFNMLLGVLLIKDSAKAVYFGQIFSTWMNKLWLIRHTHTHTHTEYEQQQ